MENKILENIKSRRTCRSYTDEQISEEQLQTILEAGVFAPSGHNSQPWHFTVIQNPEMIKEINRETKEAGKSSPVEFVQKLSQSETFDIFYGAPTVIAVSYREGAITPIEDTSAATQNMLLAAHSIGVASCWNGLVAFLFRGAKKDIYREKLGVPEGYVLHHAIAFGFVKTKVLNVPARAKGTINYIR